MSQIEGYEREHNAWTAPLAAMPTARANPAAVAINGLLYAVGGFATNPAPVALNSLEVYTPGLNSWSSKTPMPTARYGVAIGVIDGKLYVAGGFGGGGPLRTLEVYDPATNNWYDTPWESPWPMTTPRYSPAAAVLNGMLYVVGGCPGGCGTTAPRPSRPTIRSPTGGSPSRRCRPRGRTWPGTRSTACSMPSAERLRPALPSIRWKRWSPPSHLGVAWSSGSRAVASIGASNGLATAGSVGTGTATITAASGRSRAARS